VYSERDLQRQSFEWGAAVAERLKAAVAEGRTPGPPQPGERVHVRQQVFTHNLLRARTLATGLVSLAARVFMMRAGGGVPRPASLHPVTSVEYLFRCHGIGRLWDERAEAIERLLRPL
jgi:hypothetical protein